MKGFSPVSNAQRLSMTLQFNVNPHSVFQVIGSSSFNAVLFIPSRTPPAGFAVLVLSVVDLERAI